MNGFPLWVLRANDATFNNGDNWQALRLGQEEGGAIISRASRRTRLCRCGFFSLTPAGVRRLSKHQQRKHRRIIAHPPLMGAGQQEGSYRGALHRPRLLLLDLPAFSICLQHALSDFLCQRP